MSETPSPEGVAPELWNEWRQVPKNWYAIYRWPKAVAQGHTETVAHLIAESFGEIELVTEGLREQPFRIAEHRGQVVIAPGTQDIVNEKRIVRALYNAHRLPLLGRILDYEVPLKAIQDASHGDVDLICVNRGDCLCLEAKKHGSSESLLKPVLQAYTYALLLWQHRKRFLDEYELDSQTRITPGVLTFADATSGDMLKRLGELPKLSALIARLSEDLQRRGMGSLRFFLIDADREELEKALSIETVPTSSGGSEQRPVFAEPFPFTLWEIGITE